MNRGTDLARGDYLLYLNGGDTLAGSEVLGALAAVLARECPDFLYGDSIECQLNGSLDSKVARGCESAAIGMFTHHQSMVFSRAVLSQFGLRYDLSYPIAADYDFILRFLDKSATTVRFSGPIASFSAGGISQTKHHAGRREQFLVRKRHCKSVTFATRVYLMQAAGKYLRVVSPKIYWGMRAVYAKLFW
jgi:putative colanic acid biosynthesis glycosyltransferase